MILTISIVCLFSQYLDPLALPIPPNWKLEGIVDRPAPVAFAYSPDGNSLAVLYPFVLEIWKRGQSNPTWKIEPLNRATSLAWAPDGNQIAIAEQHRTGIWKADRATQAPLVVLKDAAALRDSYDLRWEVDAFLSSRRGTWNVVTGEPFHVTRGYGPHTWKPDGSSFAWVEQKQLMIATREAPNAAPAPIPIPSIVDRLPMGRSDFSDTVQGCRFAPAGDLVLCFTNVRGSIMDVRRKTIVSEFQTAMGMRAGGWLDPNTAWVLTSGSHLRYYDAKSGRLTKVIENPDRFAIAAAGRPRGAPWIPPVNFPLYSGIVPVAIAPDHRSLLVVTDSKLECRKMEFEQPGTVTTIPLWDLPVRASPYHDLDTRASWFWSPDSSKLAGVGGGRLVIVDAVSGRNIQTISADSIARQGSWNPDSTQFAVLNSADSALTFRIEPPYETDWVPVVPAAYGSTAKLEWTSELVMREQSVSRSGELITTPDGKWALQSNSTGTAVRILSRIP